jgi:protein-S-isoprenylcysteine O-methyltransferase Ste14
LNSRQRSVMVRMIIALGVFIYVGYLAWKQLPRFDFKVIISFFLIYFLWSVISEAWIYQDPDEYVVEDDDQKSYIYLQMSYMIALFYGLIDFVEWHFTRIRALEPTIIYVGVGLFLISCGIRWWGFKSIGKFFNPRVAVYKNHRLITNGAYAKIRHPLYLGSLVNFIAIPIVFNSWGSLLIIIITTIPALVYRIKVEEEFLINHFGDDYREYVSRTKKLFPGIW